MRKNLFLYLFLFLIVIRSSLDIFTNIGFYAGLFYFNVPSIVSILIIGIGISYILLRGKVNVNGVAKVFAIWILFLLPFVFISIYNFGQSGQDAIREYIRLFTIFLVFLLSYNFTNEANIEKIINCLFISLIIPSTIAIYQLITKTGLMDHGVHRVYGTLAHPNSFAYYLVFFIGLTYQKIKIEKFKIWFVLLLLLEIMLLISTFSLSGYIMFIIISFLMLFKFYKKQKLIIIFLIVLFLIVIINTPQFKIRLERIKMINIERTLTEGEVVDSFSWRIVNWSNLIFLWYQKPLTGYGLNTISIINPWKTDKAIGYAPHNDYIRYLVETGLLGAIFYILFVTYVAVFIYKKYKVCSNIKVKWFLYTILCIFVAWQITALVDNIITATTFQFYFWVVCASILKTNKLIGLKVQTI